MCKRYNRFFVHLVTFRGFLWDQTEETLFWSQLVSISLFLHSQPHSSELLLRLSLFISVQFHLSQVFQSRGVLPQDWSSIRVSMNWFILIFSSRIYNFSDVLTHIRNKPTELLLLPDSDLRNLFLNLCYGSPSHNEQAMRNLLNEINLVNTKQVIRSR